MKRGKKLSPRMIKKVKKLSKDFSSRHVGQLMDINPKTVKKYAKKDE